MQEAPPKENGISPLGGISLRGAFVVLTALCVLLAIGHAYGAEPASSKSKPSFSPNFNFDDFTKNKPFRLNILPTTSYGPAWADILLKPSNFLACKGAKIALCYYSGPEAPITDDSTPTPCDASASGIANCTCYAIPEGHPYFVDINAILNLDVYLETVQKCGSDGSLCQPTGEDEAPVCGTINDKTLIPGADLISTFSLALNRDYPVGGTESLSCAAAPYAGCMTAPCKLIIDPNTGKPSRDPVTDLELAQCACPTYNGPYQVGFANGNSCALTSTTDTPNVWSAAYTVPPQPPVPPITVPDCVPDSPGATGCPLLPPPPAAFPPAPEDVSCQTVCSEYKQSNNNGIQVGFTCDATLCTASSDPALVTSACAGLAKHSLSEILKLEIEVGYSCSASQICGCQPNKNTNEAMGRLNKAQSDQGIVTQCAYNGTLCGTPP
jgi:hypothetical protein